MESKGNNATGTVPTSIDIAVARAVMCYPLYEFDTSGYGTLSRSIVEHLNTQHLDNIVEEGSSRIVHVPIPCTQKAHTLVYEQQQGVLFTLANMENIYGKKIPDLKIAARAARVIDGRPIIYNMVAVEIYRKEGDLHDVWEIGYYLMDPANGSTTGESVLVKIPTNAARGYLVAWIRGSIGEKPEMPNYRSGIVHTPDEIVFLKGVFKEVPGIELVQQEEFSHYGGRLLRYLRGEMCPTQTIKFDDFYDSGIFNPEHPVKYRVHLSHPLALPNEPIETEITILKNDMELFDGPFGSASLEGFLETGAYFGSLLYEHAHKPVDKDGQPYAKLSIDQNTERVPLRYMTVIPDRNNVPIAIASIGDSKPEGIDHYLLFFGSSGDSIRLDFPVNVHPRKFVEQLPYILPKCVYGQGLPDALIQTGAVIPLRTNHLRQAS